MIAERAPAVTIGMPVYDGARFMRRGIESVLGQDFRDFELLISDNASTDETESIARAFAARDPRVRYVRQPANAGHFSNFLYVMNAARGEYFCWLAHDDSYGSPDYLRRLVEVLRAGSVLAFPNVNLLHYDSCGNITAVVRDHFRRFRGAESPFSLSRHAVHFCSHQVYGLYRLDALRRHFHTIEEDQDMRCFNESRFVQQIIVTEKSAFVGDVYLEVGIHEGSASRSVDARRLLRDFLTYSGRLVSMHRRISTYTWMQKLIIYALIVREHVPYVLRLLASVIKRSLMPRPSTSGGAARRAQSHLTGRATK